MSLGRSLLHAVITEGNRSSVRELRPELFTEDELAPYGFFMDFYRRYGGMPTLNIMQESGFLLPVGMGPTRYMFDRCIQRATYNGVRDTLPAFQTAFQNRDVPELQRTLADMYRTANRFSAQRDVMPLYEAAVGVMEAHIEAQHHAGLMTGITMGFPALDAATFGAQNGEVITWVARPNIGKSYTLAHVAKEVWRSGRSVLFVTMEMTMLGMARRILGVMSNINPDYIKRGTLSQYGEEMVHETVRELEHGVPFTMVAGNLSKSVDQVDALVQEFNPDCVIIDASYLLEAEKKKGRYAQHEMMADVGKSVTQMALSRNRPVHQSIQFNRSQKKGTEGELSNLGGSDVFGQISAVVIAISEGETPNEHIRRRYECLKNRDGAKPTFETNFLFEPLDFSQIPVEENTVNVGWMM